MPQELELRGDVVTKLRRDHVRRARGLPRAQRRGIAQPLVDAARLGDGRDRDVHARRSGDGNGNLTSAVRSACTSTPAATCARHGLARMSCRQLCSARLASSGSVTLQTQPSYRIRQDRYTGLAVGERRASFDALMSCASSVSLFTRWDVKRRPAGVR